MTSTGGMLMRADHGAVHPDRPLSTLGDVGVAAQLIEDLFPGSIA